MRKSDSIAIAILIGVVLVALMLASMWATVEGDPAEVSESLSLISVSMAYGLPWIICYPLAWMYFRGTDSLGYINFKSQQEGLVFLVTAILGFLVILHLTSIGVLPS